VIFDNVVSKYKDRRLNENVLAVGMDALADPAAKSNARSPFDGNVVCDFEKMVNQRKRLMVQPAKSLFRKPFWIIYLLYLVLIHQVLIILLY
jgi:actin-related protein